MSALERRTRIIEILQDHSAVPLRQMAENLKVSEMTIRRDIETLKEQGIAVITSGMIFYRGEARERPFDMRYALGSYADEKDRIGKVAAALVEPGDVIFIDIGTTTVSVARHLREEMDVTAVCFSMNTLIELQKKNVRHLIVSGGFYHKDTQTFESDESIEMIDKIRANKVFLSAAGASMEMGLTCFNGYELQAKRTCMARSLEKILLVDHSKFDRVTLGCYSDWEGIDIVITDSLPSEEWKEFFAQRGIKVILAEEEPPKEAKE